MSGEVLLEFASAVDVEASEVLLVGAVDGEGAQQVQGEASTDVEGHGVLSAVVEKTLDA